MEAETSRFVAVTLEWDDSLSAQWIEDNLPSEFDTYWISDGLRQRDRVYRAVADRGKVVVFENARQILALRPPVADSGMVRLDVLRNGVDDGASVTIGAYGTDPNGNVRKLDSSLAEFRTGETEARADFRFPAELRNRIEWFKIENPKSAGGRGAYRR